MIGEKRLCKLSITKAGKTRNKITVVWQVYAGQSDKDEELWDRRTVELHEEPRETMYDRLSELVPLVAPTLGWTDEYAEDVRATGVSLSYDKEGGMGAVITMQKVLPQYAGPLVINTPWAPEDAEEGPTMERALIINLLGIQDEALRYAKGEYLRIKLELTPGHKPEVQAQGQPLTTPQEVDHLLSPEGLEELREEVMVP